MTTDAEKRSELIDYARWVIAMCMNEALEFQDILRDASSRLSAIKARWNAEGR